MRLLEQLENFYYQINCSNYDKNFFEDQCSYCLKAQIRKFKINSNKIINDLKITGSLLFDVDNLSI